MRQRPTVVSRVAIGVFMLLAPAIAWAAPGDAKVRAQLSELRLPFIANQGQVDARVAYYAPTFAGTLFVTQEGSWSTACPHASMTRHEAGRHLPLRGPAGA